MNEEHLPGAVRSSFSSRARKHLPLLLVLLYFGTVFHGVLFMTQGAYERDAFFHARYAQLLPERGLSREFRWMQFTAWKDAFCDKDFLYHVILAPFAGLWPEALDGAKVGALLLALAALASVYMVLCRLKAPWPLLWVFLLAVGSGLFLIRLLMVRSHVLSITLMIWALYAILRGRFWPCFGVAFAYAWSYSFPLAMLLTAVAAELGRWVVAKPAFTAEDAEGAKGKPRETTAYLFVSIPSAFLCVLRGEKSVLVPRSVLATALGLGAGLLFHPYSPNTLRTLWLLLNVSAAGAAGSPVEIGSEFGRMDLASLVLALPGLLLALALAILGAVLLLRRQAQGRSLSAESAAALGAALAWFASIFVFSRLVEYFAPLLVIAAALVARDWSGGGLPFRAARPEQRSRVLAFMLGCALFIAGLHQLAFLEVRARAHDTLRYFPSAEAWYRGRYFDGAAEWMKEHLQPQATVINFHWDDFPELFYSAPFQNYIVGLDPTLLRLQYPEKMAALEAMRTQAAPLDFGKLGRLFGSEYVIMRRYRAEAYRVLKDRVILPVYEDATAVIYRTSS